MENDKLILALSPSYICRIACRAACETTGWMNFAVHNVTITDEQKVSEDNVFSIKLITYMDKKKHTHRKSLLTVIFYIL